MDFNIIDMIIIAILGISLVSGMYKGFLASGLATLGFVGAWFGALSFYPQLARAIESNTSLMGVLKYYLDPASLFASNAEANTMVTEALSSGKLADIIAGIQLPDFIKSIFQTNLEGQIFQSFGLNSLADYLGQTILTAAVAVGSFLLAFLVSYIAILLVVNLLNSAFRFPALKHFDWLLGGVFGLARGTVLVMLILTLVPMLLSVVSSDLVDDLMTGSQLVHYFSSSFAIPDLIKSAFQSV